MLRGGQKHPRPPGLRSPDRDDHDAGRAVDGAQIADVLVA
jgi:hypothetical protein